VNRLHTTPQLHAEQTVVRLKSTLCTVPTTRGCPVTAPPAAEFGPRRFPPPPLPGPASAICNSECAGIDDIFDVHTCGGEDLGERTSCKVLGQTNRNAQVLVRDCVVHLQTSMWHCTSHGLEYTRRATQAAPLKTYLLLLFEHDLAYGGLRRFVVLADVLCGVHLYPTQQTNVSL
jgi:hypothetical protein